MSQPAQWSQQQQHEHFDNMQLPDQDFDNLLDFGDVDLDFPLYDPNQGGDHQLSALADSLSSQHLPSSGVVQTQHHNAASGPQEQPAHGLHESGADFFDFTFHSSYHHQQGQQQPDFSIPQEHSMQSRGAVPPTPNSVEMHGDATRYMHHLDPQTRALLEQRYQLRKEDVANFTPLVSPAVTPHDSTFQLPSEYTVPGAYFSPLTSPALEAQNRGGHRTYFPQPHTADTSTAASPIDLDVDMLGEEAAQPEPSRKLRNKKSATAPRSNASSGRIRQSPIVKPQSHRRKGTLSVIPPKEVSELLEQAQHSAGTRSRHDSVGMGVPSSRDGSEAESISPEPLSEALMGPPPRPGSVTASPSILARGGANASSSGPESQQMCPATPASLMRLQPSPQTRLHPGSQQGTPSFVPQGGAPPINDDFSLPEPASSSRPNHDDQTTPRMPARKTPKLGPLSTPSGPVSTAPSPSPSISAVASPSSATSTKKFELKPATARGNKKRGSISSALVSPALRPKISPGIKPLLPEGANVSDETHALLLASKSNYQNILEGTHVPGVTYPEALSTNLTSKRTSHKLAEQGRRNRINFALQELQSLIPSPSILPKDANVNVPCAAGSPEESQQKKEERQNNSKASTVENAIEYIKLLKRKDEERDWKMMEQRREIEELRKKLESGGGMDTKSEKSECGKAEEQKNAGEDEEVDAASKREKPAEEAVK